MTGAAFYPLVVHDSATASAVARRRRESLIEGAVDHAFHYASSRQSALWLQVHHRYAPLFADPAFEQIYRDLFAKLAAELAGRSVHVIGLGPGGGQKESWLLQALAHAGCKLRYTPVDASLDLALLSAQAAQPFVSEPLTPVVGHFEMLSAFPAWLNSFDEADALRVVTAIGLVHGFAPSRIFPWLRGLLRPADRLLMSLNLAPVASDATADYQAACEVVMPQYANPETLAWLGQILADWGLAELLEAPRFEISQLEGVMGLFAQTHWRQDHMLEWEGGSIRVRAGERLRLFFSLRYAPGRLSPILATHGLAASDGYITPCRQEGVWHVRLAD